METLDYYVASTKLSPQTYTDLNSFLKKWDDEYKQGAQEISLFNKSLTTKWTSAQRKHFIRIFYHSRGHFKDFLWHLGNFAPSKEAKDMVLHNIAEEFNDNNFSHEQLYLDFAREEGLNLSHEVIENIHYNEDMKRFNEIHMKWLFTHQSWSSKLSAFSAYERLDTTDYELLSSALFSEAKDEHEFFRIHRQAEHFDKTLKGLEQAWEKDKFLVEEAFSFIARTQLDMWRDLSNETFNFKKNN